MVSQPQNPEFRNKSENFHPYINAYFKCHGMETTCSFNLLVLEFIGV